jgi:hypothetical protein
VTCVPSLLSQNDAVVFLTPSGWHAEWWTAWERGDFVLKIRAELPASVEKSAWSGSRTNVVCKLSQRIPRNFAQKHIALHTMVHGIAMEMQFAAILALAAYPPQ